MTGADTEGSTELADELLVAISSALLQTGSMCLMQAVRWQRQHARERTGNHQQQTNAKPTSGRGQKRRP